MRVLVDLTPILPGGENGGAKIMTLRLIKTMAKLEPKFHFTLLTNNLNHSEISKYRTKNISLYNTSEVKKKPVMSLLKNIINVVFNKNTNNIILKHLPKRVKEKLRNYLFQIKSYFESRILSNEFNADLLFCPFTAPFYHHLNIPIVSIVYDLQFFYYPFFFTPEQYQERKQTFIDTTKHSDKIISISEFVKETIHEKNKELKDEDVKTIYIRMGKRLNRDLTIRNKSILNNLNLTNSEYLIYPANFWKHKNHLLLFTAFNLFKAKNPSSTLKLVCTGADSPYKTFLYEVVYRIGLQNKVILTKYLKEKEFQILLNNSKGLIFPSLYEGFGMPVIEGMVARKPILCSNTTSLPEIAGDAAILFNPKNPEDIANAIMRFEMDINLRNELVKKGLEKSEKFTDENLMAMEYSSVFKEVAYGN